MTDRPTYFSLDTLDDRRAIWGLLHRLPPARRLAYLLRCCHAVSTPPGPRGTGPRPTPEMRDRMVPDAVRCDRGDDRLTSAIYLDLVGMAAQYGLDLVAVALDLEHFARTGQAASPPAALRAPARSRS